FNWSQDSQPLQTADHSDTTEIAKPVFAVKKFGVTGDGITNNDAALAVMMSRIPAGSKVSFETNEVYIISQPIVLPKSVNIDLNGAKIIAENSDSVFSVQSDNVIIQNGLLDLNYSSHNGIKANGKSGLYEGVSGSVAAGSNTVVLNTVPKGINEAKYITIAGITGYSKVARLSGYNLILESPVNTTVTDANIGWFQPYSNFYFLGLSIMNQIPTALNLEGGIYLSRCENVRIEECNFNNIFNPGAKGAVDHSPSIKFVESYNVFTNDITATDGGVGINLFSVVNAYINRTSQTNMADNGFYIQAYSDNINVDSFTIDGVEEGVVFEVLNSSGTAAQNQRDGNTPAAKPAVKITNGKINGATNHGLSLRQGRNLYVNNVIFTGCWNNIGQSSSSPGCSDVVFDNITCQNTVGPTSIYYGNNKRIQFTNLIQ
ncbi:MAG TPA: hypothetical protein VN374_04140, partial [Desulfitobacteriaceae bacterium]|nr:hypothetical protein [Desulfitobacteriaceae bacterium]